MISIQQLKSSYNLVDPSFKRKHKRKSNIGTISPNIFVGTLEIPLLKTENLEKCKSIDLEVQSVKSGYRDDYRDMLELITEKCTDLLLQSNSPVSHHFDVDYSKDSQTLYQKFAFIKSIINSAEFKDAVHRIVTAPVTKWTDTHEEKDIRSVRRFSNNNVKELVKGGKRTNLPSSHYLESYGLKTLPERITSVRKTDSVDTPENRFIKYALETFLKFCSDINKAAPKDSKLDSESNILIRELESQLHHSVFKNVSNAQRFVAKNISGDTKPIRYLKNGETHAPLHNFTGPGTRIDLPEVRNFKPYNGIDACSKIHDFQFVKIWMGIGIWRLGFRWRLK